MNHKVLLFLIATSVLICFHIAEAQQTKKIPRIGYLAAGSLAQNSRSYNAFQQGLRQLEYVDGENIVIEYRWAEGKLDRLPELAAELVGLRVDILVSGAGNAVTRVLKQATTSIPIVMTVGSDPVAAGLVSSLARPGGIVTGLTSITGDLSGKRLELLTETIRKLTRVAVLYDPGDPAKLVEFKETQVAAQALGVQIQRVEVQKAEEIGRAFSSVVTWKGNALIVLKTALTDANHKQIVELSTKNRLPTMFAESQSVESGGLLSYGPNYPDLFRRAAIYVDKILKGTKPADLPVEQPMKFEFVINLKTAKALNLTIPQSVLFRADKVMK